MPTKFGIALYQKIREAGISANKFGKIIGTSSGFLSNVYIGKRRPPLHSLDEWCSVLRIEGDEKDQFVELAHLEHCPKYIVDRYLALKAEIAKAGKQLGSR